MKKLTTILTGAALSVSLLLATVNSAEAATGSTLYTKTSSGNVNVRACGSTACKVLGKLPSGTKVTEIGKGKYYTYVYSPTLKKNGYISNDLLTGAVASNGKTKTVSVGSGNLNMRKSASVSATIVKKVPNGSKVTVISTSNGWSKVTFAGVTGYVSAMFLR